VGLEEFQRWCETLHLPAETVDLVARSRFSPPAHPTQERALHVSGLFPSRKMGATIQFETIRARETGEAVV
jgi:putative transposase